MRRFYVYVDFTSLDVPFYVGKGAMSRVKHLPRNKKHANVSNVHGHRREIVFETHNEIDSFDREIELIAQYHTFVCDPLSASTACNFTRGGDGVTGNGALRVGNPNYRKPKSAAMRAKLSQSKTGAGNAQFGKTQSVEYVEKRISKLRGGKHKGGEKISAALTGRKLSPAHIESLKRSHIGLKHSEETKRKMSESHQRKIIIDEKVQYRQDENSVSSSVENA